MRLLVAEDHPKLARSIANGLREEGYSVDLTFDGDEAAHLLSSNEYDCVILDIMLPGKEGWDVLNEIRARGNRAPVLCLTARDAPEDRVKGLDLGADDYLVKPFDWDELLARIRALIRRAHGQASTTIRVGDLEINTLSKTVTRAGNAITLSAREYGLLHYLALRAGQVVSRTDVWEHLYDQEEELSSNVVDVYIGYLRNKIDKPFDMKLIHTRRGHGYMLAAAGAKET
ncbi:MAG TPA: response regulator transcription factor [Tepidisphaeraceae bacterium]|jgi:DNA-binding response OmpR family regulator|nr:response regulator transcription factor [Tepidisphaeraceae bacterium]